MTKPRKDAAQHGTQSKYHTGCRCDDCRAAHAAAAREYRVRADRPGRGRPVVLPDGTVLPTLRAAARALNRSETTVSRHLDVYGDLTRLRPKYRRQQA